MKSPVYVIIGLSGSKNPDRIKGGEAAQKLWAEKRQKALMEKTERG